MDPTKWQTLWPDHAADIHERVEDLLAALNRLTGGDAPSLDED
jgi:hypothetical protein